MSRLILVVKEASDAQKVEGPHGESDIERFEILPGGIPLFEYD
jgi:hypothetical protein